MKVVADPHRCVGAGFCVAVAPDVFDQNEVDGTVRVLHDKPDEDRREAVQEAVDFCPAQALMLTEKA
jgi:ferredoxin